MALSSFRGGHVGFRLNVPPRRAGSRQASWFKAGIVQRSISRPAPRHADPLHDRAGSNCISHAAALWRRTCTVPARRLRSRAEPGRSRAGPCHVDRIVWENAASPTSGRVRRASHATGLCSILLRLVGLACRDARAGSTAARPRGSPCRAATLENIPVLPGAHVVEQHPPVAVGHAQQRVRGPDDRRRCDGRGVQLLSGDVLLHRLHHRPGRGCVGADRPGLGRA